MKIKDILEMKAGSEMDALVEKYIMKIELWRPTHGSCCTCQRCGRDYDECVCRNYSESIEDAWELVLLFMNKGYCPNLINDDCGHWALSFEGISVAGSRIPAQTSFVEHDELWCDEAPHAICKAMLISEMDLEE